MAEPRILDQILQFGKFKGMRLEEVLREHPEYIVWMYKKVKNQETEIPEWLYAVCLRDCWSSGDYSGGIDPEEIDPYGNDE